MITIILKETEFGGKTTTIYLSKITKESADFMEEAANDIALKALRKAVKKEDAILIGVGDGMTMQSYRIKELLDKVVEQYRCYDIPLEQQQRQSNFIDICPDSKTCWQSALRKLGYRQASGLKTPAYYEAPCMLWKTVS